MIRRTLRRFGNRRLTLTMLALLGGSSSCDNGGPVPAVIWEDNFVGAVGQPPNPAYWSYDVGVDWGNAQLEYDTARSTNAALDGAGNLVITARQENYLGRQYTSARIKTQALFQQTTGRFEARIRLPVGQGLWPAFWLLGADFPTVGWPACGEIDIMEYRGQAPNVVIGSIHGPGYSGAAAVTRTYTRAGPGFDADFHVFAVEWAADRITWLVDDVPYHTVTPASLPARGQWVFNHPFFILLNVAVGGNFVGPPNPATTFPQTMLVDWVRVLRLTP